MSYVIFKAAGQQFRAEKGVTIKVPLLEGEPGTKVTLIEALPRILPLEDAESSDALTKSYKKRGITVAAGVKVKKANVQKEKVSLELETNGNKPWYPNADNMRYCFYSKPLAGPLKKKLPRTASKSR